MRNWDLGDEEPSDHPAIVDEDSVTWLWMEVEEDVWLYVQQGVTINGNLGEGPKVLPWRDVIEEYGPVKEAAREDVEALS